MTAPSHNPGDSNPSSPVTIRDLRRWSREGRVFPCLTAYDATMARWLERAGVPVLLVGDSAAEVVLGHSRTIHAPLDFLIQLTAAVKRGAPNTFVMGDMPFLSYHGTVEDAVLNAGRFLTEGTADAVKLEADASFAPVFDAMSRAGIPVVGHVGCRPQHMHRDGGARVVGRTDPSVRRVVDDAIALAEAGAVMILIEASTPETAETVVESVGVPVIGCGAGPACHGQIVVTHDILGLTDDQPSFAPAESRLGEIAQTTVEQWCDQVRRRALPHTYRMRQNDPIRQPYE